MLYWFASLEAISHNRVIATELGKLNAKIVIASWGRGVCTTIMENTTVGII